MEKRIDARIRIGRRIAELRRKKGMSQRDLAERAGLQAPNLARIETGRYSTGLDILQNIADALGCTVDIIERD